MEYTIKQVSEITGLEAHVLRYYEKEGLLTEISRSQGGIRHYSDEDLEWLGVICCLKSTGMPIKKIKEFVELSKEGDITLEKRCQLLIDHKHEVEKRIDEMKHHLCKVTCKIEYYQQKCREYADANSEKKAEVI